jgi:hypothetical protein
MKLVFRNNVYILSLSCNIINQQERTMSQNRKFITGLDIILGKIIRRLGKSSCRQRICIQLAHFDWGICTDVQGLYKS